MKRYSKYKKSRLAWMGDIPKHWEIIKTYIITDNLDSKRIPLNSEQRAKMKGEFPYWGSGGIVDYIDEFIFDEELVLVGEDGAPFFDNHRDVAFYVNEKVWVNNHIHVLKAKPNIIAKFIMHSFNCVNYREYITGSTRDKLTQSDLKSIYHPIPPNNEQHAIATFLDQKTTQIDNLIKHKERKIELLKEQRTALINEAVTKGLDPNVEMKDSGVEWIGDIPKHWERIKVKYLGSIKSGDGLVSELIEKDGKYPVFGGNGILGYHSDFNQSKPVLSIGRVGEKCGNVHFISSKVWINDNSLVFEPNDKVKSLWYIYHAFIQRDLNQLSNKNTQPLITGTLVKNEYIPFPPVNEQQGIVKYLEEKTQMIDKTISIENGKIEILKEYRKSLISEAVTGKIRVYDQDLSDQEIASQNQTV